MQDDTRARDEALTSADIGSPTRFNLGASAARVHAARDRIQHLGRDYRSLASSTTEQHRKVQADAEAQLEEQLSAVDAELERMQSAFEQRQAEADAFHATRTRYLGQLEKRKRRALKQSLPEVSSQQTKLDDSAFEQATRRFTSFKKQISEGESSLQSVARSLERWPVGDLSPLRVNPPKGDLEQHLEAVLTGIGSLEEKAAAHNRLAPWIMHQPATIAVVMVAWTALVSWVVYEVYQLWTMPNTLFYGVIGAAVTVLALGVTLGLIRHRRQQVLVGLAQAMRRQGGQLQALARAGQERLDLRRDLVERVESALDEEDRQRRAEFAQREEFRRRWTAVEERLQALRRRTDAAHRAWRADIDQQGEQEMSALRARRDTLSGEHGQLIDQRRRALDQSRQEKATAIAEEVGAEITSLRGVLDDAAASLRSRYRDWQDPTWRSWEAPGEFPVAVPVARLSREPQDLLEVAEWQGEVGSAETDTPLQLPVDLVLPEAALLLVRSGEGIPLLHQAMLRLLAGSPAGKVRFSLVDALGLGNNFAPFLRLQDHSDHLVGAKVRTSQVEIERCLADLSEHAEKVIQKYLRDRYATLADYNAVAGDMAEPYQVLVIADFPQGFSDLALERLASLIQHGPRCGIFVWMQVSASQQLPARIQSSWFSDQGVVLQQGAAGWQCLAGPLKDWHCEPEKLPSAELQDDLLKQIGERTAAQGTLALPLTAGLPESAEQRWSRSCAKTLRIPLGRHGSDKILEMELGKGTAQHVLIGGRTGSGKSTLLHAMITSGAMWFSPEELRFYLIDFKKGVEFKTYASVGLPHAEVVAVESDREFGLSVLRALDEELDRRGSRFRKAEVQDLAGFRGAHPDEPMPRILLVIDEFHELFSDEDAIARDAALLLERFVRQGRAFGVHVVLGSQSLGGSSALARSTIGQMGVRIAMQCSEADAQLILSEENTAARLLERPGEAIYNDRSGMIEGNEPFQVFWVDDQEQQRLLRDLPDRPDQRPRVFEGNAPAVLAENRRFMAALHVRESLAPELRSWLGEPNALKGPTELRLEHGPAGNVLCVGHHREGACGMVMASMLAWAVAHEPGTIRLRVVDAEPSEDRPGQQLQEICTGLAAAGHDAQLLGPREVPELMRSCAGREEGTSEPRTVIMLLGLHRLRDLRQADAFAFDDGAEGPSEHFVDILNRGPDVGVHTWAWTDSVQSLNRMLQRRPQQAFGMRICFQMSSGDSSDLIDDSAASRLGLHHALLVDVGAGTREKFRPYGLFAGDEVQEMLQAPGVQS